VITGDETYLEPYQQAARVIDGDYEQLRALLTNRTQQQRLEALGPLLSERIRVLQEVIELRRARGFEPAQREILTGQSKRIHDQIRQVIGEMKAGEQTLLAEREQQTRRSTVITESTIIGGGTLAVAVCAFAFVAIRRDFAGRYRAEAALRAANEQLEARVTERTAELGAANESLQRSEGRFRALITATSDVVYSMSPDWSEMRFLEGQNFIADTAGPSGVWLDKYIHPDDQVQVQAAIRDAIDTRSIFELEHRVRRADGTMGWTYSRAIPLLDANGEVTEWFGAATDVTERQEAAIRLQSQLARLGLLGQITRAIGERQDVHSIYQVVIRTLEDQLPLDFCSICQYDPTDNQLTVSRLGLRAAPLAPELGMAERARIEIDENGLSRCVRGQLVYEPDARSSRFPFPGRLARAGLNAMVMAPLLVESQVFGVLVAARKQPHSFSSGECEFLKQVSEHVALETHQVQLYQALQRAYDDLRQTQQAVMQQERLLALGKMASGIAHDINNAISPISLYAESLLERASDLSPQTRRYLEIIQRAIDDVAQTVARMREFYRAREPQQALHPVDLNRLVRQVVDLTRARWSDMQQQRGAMIELQTQLADALPAVMGIEGELRDALTNLIFNAVDAMPDGGRLSIRTQLSGAGPTGTSSDTTSCGTMPSGEGSGKLVQLEVSDTGIGMDEETRRRCLEPFYTTKGERGTGMGLAMVYGTMQRHGAEIDVHSAPGTGTTVTLSFAVAATSVAGAGLAPAVRPATALRILLVDDDPLVLRSLRDTLETDGHHVTATDGGQAGIEAVHAARLRSEPYDAVITDLGMPHVDGRKVAAAVKAAAPETLVLMLTGWGQRLMADREIPPHVDRVLSKPARLRELREALAQAGRTIGA